MKPEEIATHAGTHFDHPGNPLREVETGPASWECASGELRTLLKKAKEEKAQAESALRECESRLENLLDRVPCGVYEFEIPSTRLLRVNQPCVRTLGYSKDKLLGMSMLDLLAEDSRRIFVKQHEDLYAGRLASLSNEYRFKARDGRELWSLVNTELLQGQGGRADRAIAISLDVTEKKRLERQLLQAQKMEAIGTLAGGVAHDFNNLLMVIQGNMALLMDQADPREPQYRQLAQVDKAARTGAQLTRKLLGYARKGTYRIRPVDLNQLILETVEILSRTRKDVVAHIALADDLWPIRADKEQIEQVLLNLIANAFEAMPEGGDLFLKTSNVPAPRSAESADPRAARDYVWLEVSDTGKGMDEATLKRVFEPYFTTKEMGRGTGLGLAAVHGIVESHQGNIRVSSEKGRGTTFSILLPDCRELHASTAGGRGAWPVVLVVDDEDFVLETVVNMLKRLGCTVFSASSGKEAIALFVQNRDKIGVVLLDMVMPGVGAAQISATIKSIRRDVKIILSSGLSEGRIEDEQLLKGVDAFLQKPYTIKDLSRMIRTVSADGAV